MKRSVLALIGLGGLLLAAAWWFLFISPKQQAISDANNRLEIVQTEESDILTRIRRLEEIKDNEVSFIFAIGDMETSIPVEPELDTFIEDVTFLGEQAGVVIESLSTQTPAESALVPGLFEMAVSISGEGEYFEVLGFLFGLEDMERLVRVNGITLVPIFEEIVPDEATTTTLQEGEETTTTSTTAGTGAATTTTTLIAGEVRERIRLETLRIDISATVFTRTPVATVVAELPEEPPAEEPPAEETPEEETTEEGG